MTAAGRRLLVIAAALAAFVALAAAVAIALVDVNRFKPEIEAAVRKHTGRTLQLKGDLGLSIFPTLALDLPASSLSARDSDAEFLGFASARIAIALLPLLRQNVVIESIDLRQARATMSIQNDGSGEAPEAGTVSEQAAEDSRHAPGPRGDSEASDREPSWEIRRLVLSDAAITLRDEPSGKVVVLSAINLETGRLAPQTQVPLALTAQLASRAPELAGALEVTATLDFDPAVSAFTASDLKLAFSGTHDRQALRASLTAGRVSRQSADMLSVAQLGVHAEGMHAADAWTFAASAARLSIDGQALSSAAIEASVSLAGAQAFDAQVALDRITGSKSPQPPKSANSSQPQWSLLAEDFLLTARRRDGPLTVQLRVGGPLSIGLENQTLALPHFDGDILIEDPQIPEGKARLPLAGAMTFDAGQERGKLQFASGAAEANFKANIDFSDFARPEIGFDLQAARLDLDRYLRPAAPTPPDAPATATPAPARQAAASMSGRSDRASAELVRVAAASPAPAAPPTARDGASSSPWRKLRVDGRLQIDELLARGMKATVVRASVHSAAGRTVIAPLSAGLYGGKMGGDLTVEAPEKRLSVKMSLTDVDFDAMARDALARSDLSGRGNVDLALSAAGESRAERIRSAQGTARFALRDVALVGIDLSAVIGEVQAALRGGGTQLGRIDRSRRTLLSRLGGSVTLANGIARNDDLDGMAPRLVLGGQGQYDLFSDKLDYTLRVAMTADRRPSSKLLRALDGFPVPVHVSGPANDLRYSISLKDVAADALARHGADVRDALVEKAEEFLGKLFGGGRKK
ncbi:MAG: AsmA family protein [Candidatus Accumulibacter sp.]|nr:AsmA family protein [Accumulibacter sp.]